MVHRTYFVKHARMHADGIFKQDDSSTLKMLNGINRTPNNTSLPVFDLYL